MSTHRVVSDSTLAHQLDGLRQSSTVWHIDHIFLRLRCGITPFQPIAVSTLLWRNRSANALHDADQTTPGTSFNTLWRIDASDTKRLQPCQGLRLARHCKNAIRRARRLYLIPDVLVSQAVLTDKEHLITLPLQSLNNCLKDRFVPLYGVRREPLCPADCQYPHPCKNVSAFWISLT